MLRKQSFKSFSVSIVQFNGLACKAFLPFGLLLKKMIMGCFLASECAATCSFNTLFRTAADPDFSCFSFSGHFKNFMI
jgi:hypothetical protein